MNSQLPTITLADISTGERVVFLGNSPRRMITSRLISLGFTPGVEIQMLQNNGHGPLVVNVRDTRVALGRGEAHDIFVERRSE
jgi:Fe2+ transport system protein FeoA